MTLEMKRALWRLIDNHRPGPATPDSRKERLMQYKIGWHVWIAKGGKGPPPMPSGPSYKGQHSLQRKLLAELANHQ